MSESPLKKKPKLESSNQFKRPCELEESSSKRVKTDEMLEEECQEKKIQAMKRKNFITACERASYQAYSDHRSRFQLVYTPSCLITNSCKYHDSKLQLTASEMPGYAEESFKIEVKTNMWSEALEVCQLCITTKQYLSANVLKDIVEIILNAHEAAYAGYTIKALLDDCQQILFQNFSAHPPCLSKSIRKCYIKFLTSPMDLKDKTFTNRSEFGYDKGIVKYCMNRLEYEISAESKDTPIVDKYDNLPVEMRQSVKGLHWQKEKFEIFELLNRMDRIERLMAVLESIIQLLQFDLAVWLSRHTSNQGRHIMRSHKPLMAYILWSDNVLYTGAVNNNCRQILRLFVQITHLGYPERCTRILTTWLNAIIQTFYICETNSNSDFPNTGKYCSTFAREFYKLFAELPNDSVIKVLEAIKPTFMMHLVGIIHIKTIIQTKEDDILKIVADFVKNSRWTDLTESENPLKSPGPQIKPKPTRIKNKLKYLLKKCRTWKTIAYASLESDKLTYPKQDSVKGHQENKVDKNHVIYTLLIVLQSYLDAYNVQKVQEKIEELNEELERNGLMEFQQDGFSATEMPVDYSYSVTEHFIKKYRSIYQMLQELMLIFHNLKSEGELPEHLKIFRHVELLALS